MSKLQATNPVELTNIGTSRGSPSSAAVTRTANGKADQRCDGGDYLGLSYELTGGTPGTIYVQIREGSASGRIVDENHHTFTATDEAACPEPVRKRFEGQLFVVAWGATGDEDLRVSVEVQ